MNDKEKEIIETENYTIIVNREPLKINDLVYSSCYGLGRVERDYGKTLRPIVVKFEDSDIRESYDRLGYWKREDRDFDVHKNNCKKIIQMKEINLSSNIENQ